MSNDCVINIDKNENINNNNDNNIIGMEKNITNNFKNITISKMDKNIEIKLKIFIAIVNYNKSFL